MNRTLKEYLLDLMFTKSNVIGFSMKLQNRIRNNKVLPEECLRFYVKKKYPIKALNKRDLLPMTIEDIPVDVHESGEWKVTPPVSNVKVIDKTKKIRPLVAGISVGNLAITAGTAGWYYKKNGNVYLGSNAHVFVDDPSKNTSGEKRIIQPGRYDKGTEDDLVGHYVFHQRIHPLGSNSGCILSNHLVKGLNYLSKLLDRRTRFKTYIETTNYIDFAISSIEIPFETKFIDYNIVEGFKGIGHGFAGSDQTSLTCKGKYILNTGYTPLLTEFTDVKEGDIVYKTGRTSCFSSAKVLDVSAVSQVNYGNFVALFEDVILTEHLLDPGDSGSYVWKKEV